LRVVAIICINNFVRGMVTFLNPKQGRLKHTFKVF
jgi:hypothetical protein